MNCYECAKKLWAIPAVAACQGCGAGLCLDHVKDTVTKRHPGLRAGCGHDTWHPAPKPAPVNEPEGKLSRARRAR